MGKRISFITVLSFALLVLVAQPSYAIYEWVDEKGVTNFTDYPKPSRQQAKEPEEEKTEATPSSDQAEPAAPVEQRQVEKPLIPAASTPQPKAEQKTAPPAQPPTSTPARQPVPVAPSMPAQPASIATPTIPTPIVSSQPTVTPQPGQTATSPTVSVPLSPRAKQAAEVRALLAKIMPILLLVGAAFYLYYCLCTYLIAKKLEVPAAWLAWIPILQIWTFLRSAGKPFWWVLLLFVPLLNIFFILYRWMCIIENLGRNKWLALLMLVPIAPLFLLGMLAFSNKEA